MGELTLVLWFSVGFLRVNELSTINLFRSIHLNKLVAIENRFILNSTREFGLVMMWRLDENYFYYFGHSDSEQSESLFQQCSSSFHAYNEYK